MYKEKIDALYKAGVFTKDDYDCVMSNMSVTEEGELIGTYPAEKTKYKYDFDGDMLNMNPREFLINYVSPPLGAEYMDKTFWTYGTTYCGICDGWSWYRTDTLTDIGKSKGHKPIEEATNEECWKMIAIASRYWEVFYKDRNFHDHRKDIYQFLEWSI